MNKSKTILKMALAYAAISAAAFEASAATTITIDEVSQRWPWNNKVDITYTVSGGQDLVSSNFCRIVFTTVIDGATYTIDGTKDVGASANAGTHTVTWTAPSGLKCDNCTMDAAVYAFDAPSGDDYMIIDLTKTTDNVTWEGLLATQAESNRRYNTDEYKTTKLALRKVPAGIYKTATDHKDATTTKTTWTTDRDYYIGIFETTDKQYTTLGADHTTSTANTMKSFKVSWNNLRLADTAPTSAVPAVASAGTGTWIQRLNYITGNKFGFDLPTDIMWEIACRANTETAYFWGDTFEAGHGAYKCDNVTPGRVDAGSFPPNDWGIYDMAGGVYEYCLDAFKTDNNFKQTNAVDPFTPQIEGNGTYRAARGGCYSDNGSGYAKSHRVYGWAPTNGGYQGFRIAMVADR